MDQMEGTSTTPPQVNEPHLNPEEEDAYGSWMQVKKPGRWRQARADTKAVAAPKTGESHKIQNFNLGGQKSGMENGSRFNILNDGFPGVTTLDQGNLGKENDMMENLTLNDAIMEENIQLPTIDLAKSSQTQNLGNFPTFNLGEKSPQITYAPTHKTVGPGKTKWTPKSKGSIPKNKSLNDSTQIKLNLVNIPEQVFQATKEASKEATKEAPIIRTNKVPSQNIIEPNNQANTNVALHEFTTEITHVSPTPQCDSTTSAPRENSLHGGFVGGSLSGHNRPPDLHDGGPVRDMDRTDAGTPELVVTLLVPNKVQRVLSLISDAYMDTLQNMPNRMEDYSPQFIRNSLPISCLARGNLPETRRSARLDRALCNGEWALRFNDAKVKHLPAVQSDHCPLLISSNGFSPLDHITRPFRFQAACWSNEEPLVPMLHQLAGKL
ncbi:Arf-GAP with ANK repeat and PH domain-containing protein cnt-1 [Bienertia sinuspersici]